ncbi:MAG: hypothetical protein IPN76_22705 [Saprospiraceae bacterium]|nr:hypothetical protein [Saprospiraceae bacterium]
MNAGSTWEKSQGFVGPTVDWIYTACILASKKNPDLLWISGSGYSNPAVFRSVNGGQTFVPMSAGLPNTLVQEIVANPDETLLFAATAVGPYVFVVEKNEWFPLIGSRLRCNGTPAWSTLISLPERTTSCASAPLGGASGTSSSRSRYLLPRTPL